MALSEKEKRRIQEEEEYRSQVRNDLHPSKKKKGFSVKYLVLAFFVLCFVLFIMVSATTTNKSTTTDPSTQDTSDLVGEVTTKNGYIDITNTESKDWKGCYFTINSKYRAPYNPDQRRYTIPAGETSSFAFNEFVNDSGEVFNPYKYKLMQLDAGCEKRFGFWQWQ